MDKIRVWLWKNNKSIRRWLIFLSVTAMVLSLIACFMFDKEANKEIFLPGPSTDGHYQIEQKCDLCHSPFAGIKQAACIDCHGEELRRVKDSHRLKKFRDPRNASYLDKINVKKCRICHKEHDINNARKMGVTVSIDFCMHCHDDIEKERPTHKGLKPESCIECHNYHDNSSLYEDFLSKHLYEDETLSSPIVPARDFLAVFKRESQHKTDPLKATDQDGEEGLSLPDKGIQEWQDSKHGQAGINCSDCHQNGVTRAWSHVVEHDSCKVCHESEVKGFLESRHGMRVTQGLPKMIVGEARLPMKKNNSDKHLDCNSCHPAHSDNTRKAAIDACLSCHDDQHSRNFKNSKHYALFVREMDGGVRGSGVSCATCHLPRIMRQSSGKEVVYVEHNQNMNLRPNQKQLRTVCMRCHGLGFSIDSLADADLVQNNFNGKPKRHIESLDMVKERLKKRYERKGINQ